MATSRRMSISLAEAFRFLIENTNGIGIGCIGIVIMVFGLAVKGLASPLMISGVIVNFPGLGSLLVAIGAGYFLLGLCINGIHHANRRI